MDKKSSNNIGDLINLFLSEGEEVLRKMSTESGKGSPGDDRRRGGNHFLDRVGGDAPGRSTEAPVGGRVRGIGDPVGGRVRGTGGHVGGGRPTSAVSGGVGDGVHPKVKNHVVRDAREDVGIGKDQDVRDERLDVVRVDHGGVRKRSMEVVVIDKSVSGISGHIKSVSIREDMIKIQFSSNKVFVIEVDSVDVSSVEIECEGHNVYVRYEK